MDFVEDDVFPNFKNNTFVVLNRFFDFEKYSWIDKQAVKKFSLMFYRLIETAFERTAGM